MLQNSRPTENFALSVTGPGPAIVPLMVTSPRLSWFHRTWKPAAKSTSKWNGTNWISASRLTKPTAFSGPRWTPASIRAPNCRVFVVAAKYASPRRSRLAKLLNAASPVTTKTSNTCELIRVASNSSTFLLKSSTPTRSIRMKKILLSVSPGSDARTEPSSTILLGPGNSMNSPTSKRTSLPVPTLSQLIWMVGPKT